MKKLPEQVDFIVVGAGVAGLRAASALAEDRERALSSGMNAHITKPIHIESMLRTMADWITGPQATDVPPAGTPPDEPATAVDLQGDTTLVGGTLAGVGPLHEANVLDPGGDLRRVADDAGAQLVPLVVLPEVRPFLG